MIEAIIVVAKAQLKIAEEKLKKNKRKLKDEEEGKKSPKDIIEHKKEEDKDPEKKEKEVKKKKIKVNAEFVKVQALRVKILVLQVIKYIVMIIEQFVMFLIATFGALGLFIVLVVLVLMIAIYGFLHIDMTVPNGEILNSTGNQYENNCIQGGQVINSDTANLDLSSLEGALTGYQKDILNVFQLYDEFIKGEGSIQPITKGFNADVVYRVYRGIPLSSSKQYSLFGKSNVENKIKENSLSYDLSNSAEGTTLSSYTVVDSPYIDSWKDKYSLPTSDSELYWAPYSVAISVLDKMQISESIGAGGSNESAFKTYVESQMTSLGIVENANECYQYIQAFVAISASEYGVDYLNVDANTYGIKEQISYLCMLFANSSDSDSNRHFYNYKIDTTQTLEYKEDIIWNSLMGSNSLESADLSSLSLSDKYLKVNNENIDKPIISLLYDKFAENADVNGFFTKIVGDSNSLNLLQSYSRGFTYLVVSDYMANILAKSAPLVVGTGSPYNCDCYEGNSDYKYGDIKYAENNASTLTDFKNKIINRGAPILSDRKVWYQSLYNPKNPSSPFNIEMRIIGEKSIPVPTESKPVIGYTIEGVKRTLIASTYSYEGVAYPDINATSYQQILAGAMSENKICPTTEDGFGFYKGRYIVAVGRSIGYTGDLIDVYFDNGTILPCIVGDSKGLSPEDYNTSLFIDGEHYGHTGGETSQNLNRMNVIEFMVDRSKISNSSIFNSFVREKYGWVLVSSGSSGYANVIKTVNHGNVFEDVSLIDKYLSEDGNLGYINSSSDINCISVGGFEEMPGQFQGPWGDLTEYINQIENLSVKAITQRAAKYVGTKPINEGKNYYKYDIDKWKNYNGYGVVRYSQTNAFRDLGIIGEEYNSEKIRVLNTTEGDPYTFSLAACGAYSTASVLSTLLGKYINPAEILCICNVYNKRYPNEPHLSSNYISGPFPHTDLAKLIEKCGFRTETLNDEIFNKTVMRRVDDCLNSNGMVIMVVGNKSNIKWTNSAHYIVIREKIEDNEESKYLIYSSTHWNTSKPQLKPLTESEVINSQKDHKAIQMIFVYTN